MSQSSSSRNTSLILLLTSALISLPWIGRVFFTRGEPREALVAQAMLSTGNWISPPAYSGVVPSKPPFLHWLMGVFSLPFGEVTEATSRLPTALAVIVFTVCFYRFLLKRTSWKLATSASFCLLSCAEWFRAASSARVDTILAVSFAGALLALFTWEERGRRGVPWLALLLCSCATLTKGPVGVVLPLGIFGLYRVIKDGFEWWNILRVGRSCALLAMLVLLVASSWYLAAYVERGDEFLNKVWYENWERLSSSMDDEPHKHSALWLLGTLILGTLPWSLVCGVSVVTAMRGMVRTRRLRLPQVGSELERFSWIAVCVIVGFFCIPSSKRSVYLLPAYPFLAVVIASFLERAGDLWAKRVAGVLAHISSVVCSLQFWMVVWLLGVTSFFVVTQLGVGERMSPAQLFIVRSFGRAYLAPLTVLVVGVLVVVGTRSSLRNTLRELLRDPYIALGWWLLVLVGVVNWLIVDPVAILLSPREWVQSSAFREAVAKDVDLSLYSYGSEQYAVSFYLERRISVLDGAAPAGSLVFVEPRNEARMMAEFPREYTLVNDNADFLSPFKRNLLLKEVRVYEIK